MKKFYLSKRFWGLAIMFIAGGLVSLGMPEVGKAVGVIGFFLTGYGSAVATKSWSL